MSVNGERHCNLYLLGFMGVGKSTVGYQVARELGMRFFDSDKVIEEYTGRGISEIFAEEGEEYFRGLEQEFIKKHPRRGCVIACGGGMITVDGTLDVLRERGVVVCLYAKPETILKRTESRTHRPLLDVEDKGVVIADLLKKRDPLYRSISPMVLTDNRNLTEIVQHTIRIYKRESESINI